MLLLQLTDQFVLLKDERRERDDELRWNRRSPYRLTIVSVLLFGVSFELWIRLLIESFLNLLSSIIESRRRSLEREKVHRALPLKFFAFLLLFFETGDLFDFVSSYAFSILFECATSLIFFSRTQRRPSFICQHTQRQVPEDDSLSSSQRRREDESILDFLPSKTTESESESERRRNRRNEKNDILAYDTIAPCCHHPRHSFSDRDKMIVEAPWKSEEVSFVIGAA